MRILYERTPGSQLKIKSLGTDAKYFSKSIKDIKLLGYNGKLQWKLEADGLAITSPEKMPFATSVVFKIY
jgi:alpha-L-fucosidase